MKHSSNFNCQIKDKNVLKKRKKNGAVVNVYWVMLYIVMIMICILLEYFNKIVKFSIKCVSYKENKLVYVFAIYWCLNDF